MLAPVSLSKASAANVTEARTCDPAADYFLRIEDYRSSIRLHREVLKTQPLNPLTYYHLGFSYGMLHDQPDEIRAYQQAIALGLIRWDLFLNLGLAYLQTGDLEGATHSLQLATLLGPDHSEPHFNLGLVYERRGMLDPARRELLVSLWLDPRQPDASNMLGVIDAEQGAYMLTDGIPVGPQNWTDHILDEFQKRRGYDLRPWLPAMTGVVIKSTEDTDRFLWDFRRTISQLLAENHYGEIAEDLHAHGLKYYGEALEMHRPSLGDDMEMRSKTDVPMGAMWTWAGHPGPDITYLAATCAARLLSRSTIGKSIASNFLPRGGLIVWELLERGRERAILGGQRGERGTERRLAQRQNVQAIAVAFPDMKPVRGAVPRHRGVDVIVARSC